MLNPPLKLRRSSKTPRSTVVASALISPETGGKVVPAALAVPILAAVVATVAATVAEEGIRAEMVGAEDTATVTAAV